MSLGGENFMDLEGAFFPVELRSVFVGSQFGRNERIEAPHHAAVLDVERDYVFAIVTAAYRLVSNKEAVEIAGEVMEKVFTHVKMKDLKCLNIIMPESRSFCHIDLVYTGLDFEPFRGDPWTPFLRVTNSYNRTRRLRFDLGFCRWICRNGMIFGAKSIEISGSHSNAGVDRLRHFAIDRNIGNIRAIEARLVGQLVNLKRYHFPPSMMLALFCKVFDVRVPPDVAKRQRQVEALAVMTDKIDNLAHDYFGEMGHHGYAALNVLTDFAARPVGVISAASSMHGYQVAVTRWMEEFVRAMSAPTFDLDEYLGDSRKEAAMLREALPEMSVPIDAATTRL